MYIFSDIKLMLLNHETHGLVRFLQRETTLIYRMYRSRFCVRVHVLLLFGMLWFFILCPYCFVLTFKKNANGKIKKNIKKIYIITPSDRWQMSVNRKMFKHSPVRV